MTARDAIIVVTVAGMAALAFGPAALASASGCIAVALVWRLASRRRERR